MSRLRPADLRVAVLWLGLTAGVSPWSPAEATSEAEAVDELMAVLGTTLPCTRYAVAWLADSSSRIEHRCAISIDEAIILGEETPPAAVYYAVDMKVARNRYTATYRFGGTPTPAEVLAKFLASFVTIGGPEAKAGKHFSPLIVYSKNNPLSPAAAMLPISPEVVEARKAVGFPP